MNQLEQCKINLYNELRQKNILTPEETIQLNALIIDPAVQAFIAAKVTADAIFDCDTSKPMDVTDDMIVEVTPAYSVLDELEKMLKGAQRRKHNRNWIHSLK